MFHRCACRLPSSRQSDTPMRMSKNKFPPKKRPPILPEDGPVFLYGLHTVRAALDNPRRTKRRLLATQNGLNRLTEGAPLPQMLVEETTPRDLDKLLGAEAVHQGVALEVDPVDRFGLSDVEKLDLVIVLDQVTDPHNVGAILRTACAFGADAVITTARYAPRETGVLAKSASGALDLIPMVSVRNLGDALETLKSNGLVCLGFDSEAPGLLRPALPAASWLLSWALREKACARRRDRCVTKWSGSTCQDRSNRSTSPMPPQSLCSPRQPARFPNRCSMHRPL